MRDLDGVLVGNGPTCQHFGCFRFDGRRWNRLGTGAVIPLEHSERQSM